MVRVGKDLEDHLIPLPLEMGEETRSDTQFVIVPLCWELPSDTTLLSGASYPGLEKRAITSLPYC